MDIRIGYTTFNRNVLEGCDTLKEAQERFSRHDKDVVKRAYYEANPKGKKKAPKVKPD